jgi:hypothetical protein
MYKVYTLTDLVGVYETLEEAKADCRRLFELKCINRWGDIVNQVYIERMTDFSIYTDINDPAT